MSNVFRKEGNKMKKLEPAGFDIKEENIKKLKEIFPNCVFDGKINFDVLKMILGEEIETGKEKYQFTWPGKSDAIKIAQQNSGGVH